MRVAVVGASGNSGTAVLRALEETPEVDSVLGIARRMPDTEVPPHSGCEWAAIDIAAASSEEEAERSLTEAFAGADAVVHLAWLVQPNSNRELLRRVNVDGTARVARAAAAAGVRQLVVASSVGAYSPASGLDRRDENWPATGVRTSHYSVDKAAQERVLDEFEAAHPDIVVTRLRPALIFQADAAYEIQRYFLGRWLPLQALDTVKPPVLPLPKGLRGVQAVHAEDAGRAYAAAVVKRAPGAFNICADDILGPQDLADIVDHGRFIELPARLTRAFLFGAHKAKLVAADEGWIDMALAVPMMDNARAKAELGWEPRYTAAQALEDLLRGMIEGRGTGSLPLRPRDAEDARLAAADGPVDVGADAGDGGDSGGERARMDAEGGVSERISRDLLGLYLSDHLTGATAGAERMERMADDFVDTPVFARLSELAEQIRLERAFLRELIGDLDLRQRPYRQAASWAAERLGRLKGNGRLLSRSPLTLVLEAELMRSAVMGKLGVWQTLEDNAEDLGLDPAVFAELSESARSQIATLDTVHEYARERAFREDLETFEPHTSEDPEHRPADEEIDRKEKPVSAAASENARPGGPEEEPPGSDPVPEAPDTSDSPDTAEKKTPEDVAEKPGSRAVPHERADELADEWGEESFPGSDPPAHY
ncbi:NAD-dependent epimerase/dehydratase family protein [Leucobacter sp. CSA1]|uniref:NAD-dependent epimerase/dehydratase family protein n=1 Tax=Leucobacter chromiisoli TaxID=2796471 RepID=A0A934UUP4_9MICO|nr:NAD-dependent epimerase/dehydratase family protein [Leucobacter chromiisoli]MBK0419030.1 NAD-dependent epimerase/dehydratase family protein [Leucobacter chromiisoli]